MPTDGWADEEPSDADDQPIRWAEYDDQPLRPEYPPLPPAGVRLAWAAFVIAAAFLLALIVGLLLRMAS